ncbi:hypothetical protein [Rhizobium johnstonii]|uniref:hypothetical protein n=1 Tax=Rhizobium johnstonii TaxID=3019933 RepID=UPI003F969A55
MKNLLKTMAKVVRKSVFVEEERHDQVAVEFVPTSDDRINDILARVKAFNRVPLYQPTVEERKAEADTMRDLKSWMRKLSDNDRAIVAGRKPWEILNHMLGIVPIDGVVAVGRGASYDFAATSEPTFGKRGFEQEFAPSTRAANGNTPFVPKAETAFQARGLAAMQQELRAQGMENGLRQGRNMEPTYAYEPPKPPASILYANVI